MRYCIECTFSWCNVGNAKPFDISTRHFRIAKRHSICHPMMKLRNGNAERGKGEILTGAGCEGREGHDEALHGCRWLDCRQGVDEKASGEFEAPFESVLDWSRLCPSSCFYKHAASTSSRSSRCLSLSGSKWLSKCGGFHFFFDGVLCDGLVTFGFETIFILENSVKSLWKKSNESGMSHII